MAQSNLNKLNLLLNQLGDRGKSLTIGKMLHLAAEASIPLTTGDLWDLAGRLVGTGAGELVCPPEISGLAVTLLAGREAKAVLDPWAGIGSLLQPVVDALHPSRFVGLVANEELAAAARLVVPQGDVGEFRISGLREPPLLNDESFDVVVSIPPFGIRGAPVEISGTKVDDTLGNQLLLHAALHLQPSGVGLFVVPPAFFLDSKANSVVSLLSKFDLYVDAAFLLPGGTFRPFTGIETYLIVIRRGPAPDLLFVAEMPTSAQATKTILNSYGRRQPGVSPPLGSLVRLAEFRGLHQLVARHAIEQHTKRSKLPAERLGNLCVDFTRCPRQRSQVADKDNSFFLPLSGTAKCALVAAALPTRTDNWAQIQIDPKKADAQLVATYFDGSLGRLAIDAVLKCGPARTIPFAAVPELQVWLPPLTEQRAILALDRRIQSLSSDLEGLRGQLWRKLDQASKVEVQVNRVNREDTFPQWLDTLPFPLASILWTYHTLKDTEKRGNQLDHFFEGLAQFLAVLVLSAVRRNHIVFDAIWKEVKRDLESQGMSLEVAGMGTWVAIYQKLAARVRQDLGKNDEQELWQRLFACDDKELLEVIVNKKMVELLQRANRLRNGWRGHGGFVSEAEAQRREGEYQQLLLTFRQIVDTRWETYPLVLPQLSKFSGGVFRYTVQKVSGVRSPFEVQDVELKKEMEDGYLHMLAPRLGVTCQLLPFVRLGPSPQDKLNACYFYSRVDAQQGFKYVAYHYVDTPDLFDRFPGVTNLLAELAAV